MSKSVLERRRERERDGEESVPSSGDNTRGRGSVELASFSRSAGAIVRKSHPAKLVISAICASKQGYKVRPRQTAVTQSLPLKKEETHASERGTHDNGVVPMNLVVVVNLGHTLNPRVGRSLVLPGRVVLLVPIQDTSNEGRNESDASLRASDGLTEPEQEGEVAVDLVDALELACGLDSLPC